MFRPFQLILVAMVSAILAGISWVPAPVQAQDKTTKIASENLLPATTKAWFSVPDGDLLREKFEKPNLANSLRMNN